MRLRTLDGGRAAGVLAAGLALFVVALLGERKFGLLGLLAPLIVVGLIAMVRRPGVAVTVTVGLTILCEGSSFGVGVITELYKNVYGGIEPLDLLVTLTFFSVFYDLLRRARQPRLPRLPAFALILVVLATVAGIVTGNGTGTGIKQALLSVHAIVELIVMTVAVYNLDLDESQLVRVIRWGLVLAAVKAVLGLIVMSLGLSTDIDAGTSITYYEPTPNWFLMLTMFGLVAAALGGRTPRRRGIKGQKDVQEPLRSAAWWRGRGAIQGGPPSTLGGRRMGMTGGHVVNGDGPSAPPVSVARSARGLLRRIASRPGLIVLPLVVAALLLSYRRSFWIAAVLGLVILIPLASTPRKRLMIVPIALLIAGGIWAVGSVPFQAQTPIVKRAQSLSPTKLQSNAEDRYRLDERANVIAEIKANPVSGLGVVVPWVATVRSLGIEHVGGREYVHFALLWWWLKLGVLGAFAYVGVLVSMAVLAFQTWRRQTIMELRYFGLASLCCVAGLVVIETTATFTGVDPRFSVILGAQFGLLAALSQPIVCARAAGRDESRPRDVFDVRVKVPA